MTLKAIPFAGTPPMTSHNGHVSLVVDTWLSEPLARITSMARYAGALAGVAHPSIRPLGAPNTYVIALKGSGAGRDVVERGP